MDMHSYVSLVYVIWSWYLRLYNDIIYSYFGRYLSDLDNYLDLWPIVLFYNHHNNLRYRGGKNFPFEIIFTDRCNWKHKIVLKDKIDQLTTTVPCCAEILCHGYERDRTGLDAQTRVAEVTFSYAESYSGVLGIGSQPHGFRVQVPGFKTSKMGEASIHTERWKDVVSMAKDAAEAGGNLASMYASLW